MNDGVSWTDNASSDLRVRLPSVVVSDVEQDLGKDMWNAGTKLPPELLTTIFIYCTEGGWVNIPYKQDPSMVVSQVCSYWREVAFAEPLLWGRISVTKPSYKQMSPLVRMILARCGGNGAIELRITAPHSRDWEEIQDLISNYPSRLRKIQLYNGSPPKLDVIVELSELMGAIHIKIVDLSWSGWPSLEPRILRKCPNIHSIEVIGGDSTAFPPFAPPRAHLTRLELMSTSLSVLLHILSECLQLEVLVIGLKLTKTTPSLPGPPLILEHLRSMLISEGQGIGEFLSLLVLPSLNEFFFEDTFASWPQIDVISLFERSTCSIEHFYAPHRVVPTECIIPLLQAMPHIRVFRARPTDPVPRSIFDAMRRDGLAPRLQILGTWPMHPDALESAVEFLGSRWSRGALGVYEGIREAHLPVLQPPGEEDGAVFPDLNGNGRKVYFSEFKRRRKGCR